MREDFSMQKLAAVLILLQMLSNPLHARCINAKHRKVKIKTSAGKKEEAYDYSCQVRERETENFDAQGNCKNCGCSKNDHDNVQG